MIALSGFGRGARRVSLVRLDFERPKSATLSNFSGIRIPQLLKFVSHDI